MRSFLIFLAVPICRGWHIPYLFLQALILISRFVQKCAVCFCTCLNLSSVCCGGDPVCAGSVCCAEHRDRICNSAAGHLPIYKGWLRGRLIMQHVACWLQLLNLKSSHWSNYQFSPTPATAYQNDLSLSDEGNKDIYIGGADSKASLA